MDAAPPATPEVRAAIDAEHLRLLKFAYYIGGGVTAAFSCLFIFHFAMFLIFGLNPQIFDTPTTEGKHPTPPPPGLFLGLACGIACVIVLGWIYGALQIYVGRCLDRRQNLNLIFVVAVIECLGIPWGTTIGVLTFIVLNRPSVRALFR